MKHQAGLALILILTGPASGQGEPPYVEIVPGAGESAWTVKAPVEITLLGAEAHPQMPCSTAPTARKPYLVIRRGNS